MIIWLASYPRSGNTFLRVILNSVFGLETYSIYDDKFDIGSDAPTKNVVGHSVLPEDFDIEVARADEALLLIKTHELIPDCVDKVIYLIRDGRESSLSSAEYSKSYLSNECVLEDILLGRTLFGTWREHLDFWQPANTDTMLLLRFEELVSDPLSQVQKIAEFIDVQPTSSEIPTFAKLHEINPKFFRSGRTDSWKERFSVSEEIMFWLLSAKQMRTYYPNELPPEPLRNFNQLELIQEVFLRSSNYYQDKLDGAASKVAEQEASLAAKSTALEATTRELEQMREQLFRLKAIVRELSETKASLHPIAKYRIYKMLLDC